MCDFKEALESPLRPHSGEGRLSAFRRGGPTGLVPRGLGAIPTPIENHLNRDVYNKFI